MTYLADLSPCQYLDSDGSLGLVAVGWLSRDHPFTQGPVAAAVRSRLASLMSHPYCPISFFGSHLCESCAPPTAHPHDHSYPHGFANLLVPGNGLIYACPALIEHYIDIHRYQPPEAFCWAVARSPPVRSAEYFLAVLANGGEVWAEILAEEFSGEPHVTEDTAAMAAWAAAMRVRTVNAQRALRQWRPGSGLGEAVPIGSRAETPGNHRALRLAVAAKVWVGRLLRRLRS